MLRLIVGVAVAVLVYRMTRPWYDHDPEEPAAAWRVAAAAGLLAALFWPWSLPAGAPAAFVAWRRLRRPERRPADPRRIAALEAAVAVPLDEVIEQIEQGFR
jgi:hypothetical protein